MAEHRPFPPSPRRSALARAAGLQAASPTLVGALACASAVIAVVAVGRTVAARLGAWVAAACEGSARLSGAASLGVPGGGAARSDATSVGVGAASGPADAANAAVSSASSQLGDAARSMPRAVLELALPILAAIAIAAVVAHLAQTRAVWIPRRTVRGAPAPEPARVRRATLDLTSAGVIAAVALGWLWIVAPKIASSIAVPLAAPALIASFVATVAIAWVGLGVIDALVRHADLAAALRMTHADKREDDRLAGADPRWRARREELARADRSRTTRTKTSADADTRTAVAGSSLLLLGDDIAIAIAWDPIHRPVPTRTAIGRGPRMTQLLGLARHHAIAVHRDPALAAMLATAEGPAPEAVWPRLAEIIAATRSRGRSI